MGVAETAKLEGGFDRLRIRVLPDGRVPRETAAEFLGVKAATLAHWHWQGKGPRCVRVGGRCFYYLSDLESFVRGQDPR
jgi:hypothetical protein